MVKRNITFDAHVGYNFTDGLLDGIQLSVSVKNLTDKLPPYFNTGSATTAW